MRLLNTHTLNLVEPPDDQIAPYAILSHRWEEEEVTFRDVQAGNHEKMIGWSKIKQFCRLANFDGHDYAWVDTCCIDKSSSADLSEAINAMYRWYKEAEICYVYLSDVTVTGERAASNCRAIDDAVSKSLWFTRGWTLQELLAPKAAKFYQKDWAMIGTRDSLSSAIMMVTGISETDICSVVNRTASVAKRMSWAATRKTTRPEDLAYSLMGLFDVNMPLLYGEGAPKAFRRLQLHILEQSEDESLFAWYGDGRRSGLLASSPSDFKDSGYVESFVRYDKPRQPYRMTNKGLVVELPLSEFYPDGPHGVRYWRAPLACSFPGTWRVGANFLYHFN